jgi:hypothetical protein
MEDNGVFEDLSKVLDVADGPASLENGKRILARMKQIGGNHYKDMPIQPSEYITKNGLGWYEGNAIKYITRYKTKGGKQDIEKAIHYLELLLESLN